MPLLHTHSIRFRLAATLFLGFLALLSCASSLIYFVARGILQDDFDARLFARAQAVIASVSQKGTSLDVDWTELPQEFNSRKYSEGAVQIIDSEGHSFFKNSPLSNLPTLAANQSIFKNTDAPQIGPLRVLTLSFVPRVEEEDLTQTPPEARKACVLAVAMSRESLNHSLRKLALILVVMTGGTSLLSLVLVWIVVRRGLRPLDQLGSAVAQVQADSLRQSISTKGLPEELLPIVSKLNDLLARLDVSFARERRFSADVSHELRTPVTELKTLAEVMLQERSHGPEVQQAFEDARDIAIHMEALVNVLLEMVRQETGSAFLVLSKVDLETLIRSTWEKRKDEASRRDVRLKMPAFEKDIILTSEPRLLGMVLANLLDNAIEYSPRGSEVEINFHSNKESSSLTISNSTENLTPSDLPHLFERFWRKDPARGESGHFGIGLALTRTLCQRLHIHLAASMKGTLVQFWLHLPNNHPPPQ